MKKKITLIIFWFFVSLFLVSLPWIITMVVHAKERFLREERPARISITTYMTKDKDRDMEDLGIWGDSRVEVVYHKVVHR